jgi:hypothetical protein
MSDEARSRRSTLLDQRECDVDDLGNETKALPFKEQGVMKALDVFDRSLDQGETPDQSNKGIRALFSGLKADIRKLIAGRLDVK